MQILVEDILLEIDTLAEAEETVLPAEEILPIVEEIQL